MRSIQSAAELKAYYTRVRERNRGQWVDFEPIIQSIYETIMRPGDAAVDAGALIGRHTFPMARAVGKSGVVYAIEPQRWFAWRLRVKTLVRHPEHWRTIRVCEAALSDSSGSAEFFAAEEAAYSGLRRREYPRPDMKVRRRKVLTTTLDELVPASAPLKFIKLDLEGGEFHAIRGAARLMEDRRPVIVFEYDRKQTPELYGYRHEDLTGLFDRRGYRVLDILGVPFDNVSLWDAAEVWYYAALPRECGLEAAVVEAIEDSIETLSTPKIGAN